MKNTKHTKAIKILIVIVALIAGIGGYLLVKGNSQKPLPDVPQPEGAYFAVDLGKYNLVSGYWRLIFVPLSIYNTDPQSTFNKIKIDYLAYKKQYGLSSDPIEEQSNGEYKIEKNFSTFHYSLRANPDSGYGESVKNIWPYVCNVTNGICKLLTTRIAKQKYFVVLERLNSKNEVYFSGVVDIDFDPIGEVVYKTYNMNTYTLVPKIFKLSAPDTLEIKF